MTSMCTCLTQTVFAGGSEYDVDALDDGVREGLGGEAVVAAAVPVRQVVEHMRVEQPPPRRLTEPLQDGRTGPVQDGLQIRDRRVGRQDQGDLSHPPVCQRSREIIKLSRVIKQNRSLKK